MKSFKGNGIVWDPATQKPLCKFEDGVVKTDNPKIIEVLEKRDKRLEQKDKEMKQRYQERLEKLKKAGVK